MTRGKCRDKVGERYGSVVVTKRAENDKAKNARWTCKCDCGKEVTLLGVNLKRLKFCSKQCHLYKEHLITNIEGQRFGRLVAVKCQGVKGKHSVWSFKCDCGGEKIATATNCKSGYVSSCGCLAIESRVTHGRSHTREYKSERYQAYTVAKRRATPTGKQTPEVLAVYEEAREMTRITGEPHEVDHIIPIQGVAVSGLHVADNLQILTRHQNRKKSRTFNPNDVC